MKDAEKTATRSQRWLNIRRSVTGPSVRRAVVNGLHMTAMNTVAVLTTNLLNAWMQDRGMTSRQFSIHIGPNPHAPTPERNPLRRMVG